MRYTEHSNRLDKEKRIALDVNFIMSEPKRKLNRSRSVRGFMNRFGLLIQGPIYSAGISGSQFLHGKSNLRDEQISRIRCEELILQNLMKGKDCFEQMVVAIREPEKLLLEGLSLRNAKVLVLPQASLSRVSQKQNLTSEPLYNANTKKLQFRSLLAGFKELQSSGCTHAIKIRTDQTMNLPLLLDEFRRAIEIDKYEFFAPFSRIKAMNSINDFFLGGSISSLVTLSSLMISDALEFSDNVHFDLFAKGVMVFNPELTFEELRALRYPQLKIFHKTAFELSTFALRNVWKLGSRKLIESIEWRGEVLSRSSLSSLLTDSEFRESRIMINELQVPLPLGAVNEKLSYSKPTQELALVLLTHLTKMRKRILQKAHVLLRNLLNQTQRQFRNVSGN